MNKTALPIRLTRARLLKIVAGVAGGAVGAYILYELAPWLDGPKAAALVRAPLKPGTTGSRRMRDLVRYATLAASGHNAQPWRFLVDRNRIEIHPDLARRLPAVDPHDRELWISLGCALENLSLAARTDGFETEVTYPGVDDFIRIDLTARKPEDGPYVAAIPKRQNTRSEYDGRKFNAHETEQLIAIPLEPGISLHIFDGRADSEKVLEYVSAGNQNQFEDRAFVEELVRWIRFDKREAMASMDGHYSLCMSSSQVPRWIGQEVVRRMTPQKQIDSDAKLFRSSSGAVAIASDTDSKPAWVRTGQVYQRLALLLTSLNTKSAFLNQPNEVSEVRTQFQSALGFGAALPQLLLRYGRADPMASSFRRPVDDVIVWA